MDRLLKQYKDLYSEICAGFRQMQQQGDGNYTEEADDLDIQYDKLEDLELTKTFSIELTASQELFEFSVRLKCNFVILSLTEYIININGLGESFR